MRLIHDDGVVAAQQWVGGQFRQQQPVGHQDQARCVGYLVRESYAVANGPADRLAQFFRDSRGQGTRCESARLRMRDQSRHAPAEFETVLRQLRTLPRTGIAGNDEHLVLA